MLLPISNVPRDYGWGSRTLIADALGRPAGSGPEAELWLGAHPGSPSRIDDPSRVGGAPDLAAWIAADPMTALGAGLERLPFLLKLLAAAAPLSLQAHPSPEQAREGFARENALGIPLDAAHRNYKDAFAKPELVVALSERFEALSGFRDPAQVVALLQPLRAALAVVDGQAGPSGSVSAAEAAPALEHLLDALDAGDLRGAFERLINRGDGVEALVNAVTVIAASAVAASAHGASARPVGLDVLPELTPELVTAAALAEAYPGDPGIVIALLLNRVSLARGEAVYLPAGNIHAYLEGLGVELMTASDNVLRGGLTPKHVDVPELLSVLDFRPLPAPYLAAVPAGPGATLFAPDGADFRLVALEPGEGTAAVELTGPAILIATAGALRLEGELTHGAVARGESRYITPDERTLRVSGDGTAFLATTA